jgi:agmatine deiminase
LEPQLVLEGGAIDVNGQGLCLTTEQCVLNENRNLGKTKKDVEKFLADYLGIKKTIWLWKGLVNDHTDGHIDELARFVGPNKIVCAYESNEADENYAILKNNYETLCEARNLANEPFEVIKLPMPHMQFKETVAGLVIRKLAKPRCLTRIFILAIRWCWLLFLMIRMTLKL